MKQIALVCTIATSFAAYAEMISIDSTCASERQALQNISRQISPQSTCRSQIGALAKCCAGDPQRSDCVTAPISVSGSGGSLDAGRASATAFESMISLAQDNIDRCNRQLEKARCSERPPMQALQSAINSLTNCLQQGQQKMAAFRAQSSAVESSAGGDRQPASDLIAHEGDESAKVQLVSDDQWTTIELMNKQTGQIQTFNTKISDCAYTLNHFQGSAYSIYHPGGCK